MGAARAGHHRDILLAVRAVGDRRAIGGIAQAHIPQLLAGGVIIGRKIAVNVAHENHAVHRQHATLERGTLPDLPQDFAGGQVEGFQPPVIAVAVETRAHILPNACRQDAPYARLDRNKIGASFGQLRYQNMRARVVGGGHEILGASRGRTDEVHLAVPGERLGIDFFCAGLGIDRQNNVLQARIEGISELAGVRIQHVIKCFLAGGGDQTLAPRIEQYAFKHPVMIPLVVGHVLEVPGQLAGLRIQGQRRVHIEGIIISTLDLLDERAGVIGLRRAEIDQVGGLVITAGHPDGAPGALFIRHAVPAIAFLPVLGDGAETPYFLAGLAVDRHDEGMASARTKNDITLGDDGSAVGADADTSLLAEIGVPFHIAGLDVEGDEMAV